MFPKHEFCEVSPLNFKLNINQASIEVTPTSEGQITILIRILNGCTMFGLDMLL